MNVIEFINYRFRHAVVKMAIALPVKSIVDDDAFWWSNDAVSVRLKLAGQSLGVGIDQSAVAVKPLAVFGVVRPVRLYVVQLPFVETIYEDAPNVSPTIRFPFKVNDLRRFGIFDSIV